MTNSLSSSVQAEVDRLYGRAIDDYRKRNLSGSISALLAAWGQLPEPKTVYDESFHISRLLSKAWLELGNCDEARSWCGILFKCATDRLDSGERDFLAGRIALSCGDVVKARHHFQRAFQKSDGRIFEGEDPKYQSLASG